MNVGDLRRDSAVLDGIGLGMLDAGRAQLCDRQLVEEDVHRALHAICDNLVIAATGFLAAILADVDALPVNSDTGLPRAVLMGCPSAAAVSWAVASR